MAVHRWKTLRTGNGALLSGRGCVLWLAGGFCAGEYVLRRGAGRVVVVAPERTKLGTTPSGSKRIESFVGRLIPW